MNFKNWVASGLLLSGIAYPSALLASEGAYITGSFGISRISDIDVENSNNDIEFDSGLNYEIGIGYDFGKTRIEASWERNNTDDISWGSAKEDDGYMSSFLGSVIYDFENNSKWTPFLGASVGNSYVEVDDHHESGFSYGAQAGISYKTSENQEFFVKVNKIVVAELEDLGGWEITNANTTGIKIGTRFSF